MLAATFSSTFFLALAVQAQADTFPKLAFTQHYTAPDSRSDIVDRDRLRVNYIMGQDIFEVDTSMSSSSNLYMASVGVGCPHTDYSLVIDSGSSNTWVGAGIPYVKTNTSVPTTDHVAVNYGSGNFSGKLFLDKVILAPGLVIYNQSIGVAKKVNNITGFDGILGIGPTKLTENTLTPEANSTIGTVLDNLYLQGMILNEVVGISFEPPTNSDVNATGEITFGGVDPTKFNGEIQFTNVTSTYPSSDYWGLNSTVTYGENITILPNSAGIVDTGTTLVLFCIEAYYRYQNATGGIFDSTTRLLKITSDQYKNLKSLYIQVNGFSEPFELTPNAQIWPRSYDTAPDGTPGGIYLVVANLGTHAGAGLDYVLGQKFLQRYYPAFKSDNSGYQVGLASTNFTLSQSN